MTFGKQVKELVDVMEEMGNPFLEETTDHQGFDTRDIIDPTAASYVRQTETIGQQRYQTVMTDRLVEQTTPIAEPIKKNKLSLFSRPSQREKSKTSLQVSSLKSDCSLFSRVGVVWDQYREGSLKSQTREKRGKGVCRWKVRRIHQSLRKLAGGLCQPSRVA